MKRKLFQRAVCLILSVTTFLGAFGITSSAATSSDWLTNSGTAATLDEMSALLGMSSYAEYASSYDPKDWNNTKTIEIAGEALLNFYGDGIVTGKSDECKDSSTVDLAKDNPYGWVNFEEDGENNWENTVYVPSVVKKGDKQQAASITWNISIDNDHLGLYYIEIEYFNCIITESNDNKSSVSSIERALKIDGKVPFDEASSLTFDKHWVYNNITVSDPVPVTDGEYTEPGTYVTQERIDKYKGDEMDKNGNYKISTRVYYDENGVLVKEVTTYKIKEDINGNSISPEIMEYSTWSTYICRDASGFNEGYFKFLFDEEKEYSITLESQREPIIIKSIKLVPVTDSESSIPSYEEYLKNHENATKANGKINIIQAEFPDAVSDPAVVPSNDNSSAVNEPISASSQVFNVIGEIGFSSVGQWAAYKFTVSESGMYNISARYLQDTLQGMFVCRSIKIAGGDYGYEDGSPAAPYLEAEMIRFDYNKKWQSDYLGFYVYKDKNGNKISSADAHAVDGKFVDVNGDPVTVEKVDCEFYFEKNVEYTIYFECSLGDLREYLERAERSLERINECYLQILQRTGSEPDPNQDYLFYEVMPEVLVTLLKEAEELNDIARSLEALSGTTGSHIATLDTVVRVLRIMGADYGDEIAANLSNLKTYLGTLGTWINDSKQSVVTIDSFGIVPANTDDKLPRAKAGFFRSLWFEICSFIYSFFTNYDQMGLTEVPEKGSKAVSVWFATGRDQSQIWRSMVDSDDGFTNTYNTAVELKLVTGGTLLPSILSGNGPDVYMGLSSSDVINYAIRSAVFGVNGKDVKSFGEDVDTNENVIFRSTVWQNESGNRVFEEKLDNGTVIYRKQVGDKFTTLSEAEIVAFQQDSTYKKVSDPFSVVTDKTIFAEKAVDTLELLDVYYGVPNTMNFAMMFYRMDVLAQLGLEVPESWNELISMLSELQTKNMSIGVAYISALDFMMYQMGGNMWKYTDSTVYDSHWAGSKIDLDSPIAIEAFDFVCRLYTDYSLPVSYDAANRFRTGEMPIVIGSYESIYNTLVVYATEIEGRWEFCPLPGSETTDPEDEDGFNYDSLATVSATVILNGCDDLLTAWQFVQWQTSASVQAEYGNRIVALIGPAAKYETANIQAINDMSWTAREKAAIMDQMDNLNAIKNYPGSYIYARYMKFAFLDAYNNGADPYEAMMSYIPAINDEIARKRKEFGLPTAETEEQARGEYTGEEN